MKDTSANWLTPDNSEPAVIYPTPPIASPGTVQCPPRPGASPDIQSTGVQGKAPPEASLSAYSRPTPFVTSTPSVPSEPLVLLREEEELLKNIGRKNAMRQGDKLTWKREWAMYQDLKNYEIMTEQPLSPDKIRLAVMEWVTISKPFLRQGKDFNFYMRRAAAKIKAVRSKPGGQDTLNRTAEALERLEVSQLPVILGYLNAPVSWRRVAGLHREIARLSTSDTYFLTCRDCAKIVGLKAPSQVWEINEWLERQGVIKVVKRGTGGEGGKPTTYRYLLSTEIPEPKFDDLEDL